MSTSAPAAGSTSGGATVPPELLSWLTFMAENRLMRPEDIAPAPGGPVTASVQVIQGGANELCGWALTETTGTATAALRLRDGNSATSKVIARINLAANESVRDYFDAHHLEVVTGMIFLEWLSGSIEGTLWVR